MSLEAGDLAGVEIPDFHLWVFPGGREVSGVWGECKGCQDSVVVGGPLAIYRSVGGLPEDDGAIPGPSRYSLAI